MARGNSLRSKHNIPSDLSSSLMKPAPQDTELEAIVLGMALSELESRQVALELLKPEDFFLPAHHDVFEAMHLVSSEGEAPTPRSVISALRKSGKIEQIGGHTFVLGLTQGIVSSEGIRKNCLDIKQFSIRRMIIQFCGQKQVEAYDDEFDSLNLIKELEEGVSLLQHSLPKKKTTTIKDLTFELTNSIQSRTSDSDGVTGVPTGFPKLDRMLGGFQNTDLIILAARPGMGKTSAMLQFAMNAAAMFKMPVGIFSLEMSSIQLAARATSIMIEMPLLDVRRKMFDEADWSNYNSKIGRLTDAPIYIDDTPGIGILELRMKAAQFVAEHGVKMIFIDYLQLMKGDQNGNREQEISSIARALKGIAKTLNVPVMALSQLSRSVESRGGMMKPILSDLRESGSIEQDADVVMFLWRPEYYLKSTNKDWFREDSNGPYAPGATEVNIAKHRNGETGATFIRFVEKYTKFEHIDSPYQFDKTPTHTTEPLQPQRLFEPPKLEPSYNDTAYPVNDDAPF